jgi:bacillithiol synthase
MPWAPQVLPASTSFRSGPNLVFRHHVERNPAVETFVGTSGWGLDLLEAAAERACAVPRDRSALARALARQQELLEAPEAARRAADLVRPDAAALVTGQQAGLFGGPLYVLYKAAAVVRLAAALQEHRGKPVVPVFWVASDDHDFTEIRVTTVIDDAGSLRTLRYSPAQEPVGQPASRIVLEGSAVSLADDLAAALGPRPERDELVERLRHCYRPGVTLASAFGRLLAALFPGLVVVDPADPELKALMVPVLDRELAEGSPVSRIAAEEGARLVAAGYHQQVPVRPGFLSLFWYVERQRRSLAIEGDRVQVRGTALSMTRAEAREALAHDPSAWSPGALLRPLAQDLLFPTAGYVGGPAEIAYHAQIGPAYSAFGLPRPVLVPRPSATLVDPAQARLLSAEELELPDLEGDVEALLSRLTKQDHPRLLSAFGRAREALEREMSVVEEAVAALDPTLRAAASGARGRAAHQIEALQDKAVRALKKRDQSRAERLRRAREALFPGGSLQERGLGLVSVIGRRGTALCSELVEALDCFAEGHQVLFT